MQHSEHEESLTSNDVWGMFLHFKCFTASLSSEHSNSLWGRCYAHTHCKCKQLSPKPAEKNQTKYVIFLKEGKKKTTKKKNPKPNPLKTPNLFRILKNFINILIVTFHNYKYEKQNIQTQIQYLANKWSSGLKDLRKREIFQLNL